jgi:hypothetical protein
MVLAHAMLVSGVNQPKSLIEQSTKLQSITLFNTILFFTLSLFLNPKRFDYRTNWCIKPIKCISELITHSVAEQKLKTRDKLIKICDL